ncbi:MAG: glycosyltransferase involved in cell wall biosynthesis [Candidatus Poriferisodalaceae bacterium]|jgi:glycosyltransferase involved in cell wall biosynthesis
MTASISVVVVANNAEATLRQALASVAGQILAPTEVVLVDDASTDATVKIAHSFADLLPIRVIEQVTPVGSAAAGDIGADAATGDFVAVLDAADVWFPHHLYELKRALGEDDATVTASYFNWTPLAPVNPTPDTDPTVSTLRRRVLTAAARATGATATTVCKVPTMLRRVPGPPTVSVPRDQPRRTVSFVVPAYKAEDIIGPTLAGILTLNPLPDGSFPVDEVIVVDDCSPDKTSEIAARFSNHLPLRILRLDENSGVGVARTTATDTVTTELVVYADADDIVFPDHLDLMLAEYAPGKMVSARPFNWVVDGEDTTSVLPASEQNAPDPAEQMDKILKFNFVFIGTLVDTEHFARVGAFGALRKGEDWDAWIRMIRSGITSVQTAGLSVLYRVHASSSSHSSPYGLLDADLALLESMLPDSDATERRLLKRSLRRRRAVHQIVTARIVTESNGPMRGRLAFLKAAILDPTLFDFGKTLRTPLARGLGGVIDPYRFGGAKRTESPTQETTA